MEFRRVLFRSADRLMKVRLLGCGTSSGVPRIGNDWGVCDPLNPRNRRTRASIMVEADGYRILVDTGPDLREQLLAEIGRAACGERGWRYVEIAVVGVTLKKKKD